VERVGGSRGAEGFIAGTGEHVGEIPLTRKCMDEMLVLLVCINAKSWSLSFTLSKKSEPFSGGGDGSARGAGAR
jgi:hypothetical protein